MDRRYQKRMSAYWIREKKKILAALDRLNMSSWFDLWHTHPDWKSKGNKSPEQRVMVIKITYELLLYSETLVKCRSTPIQIFATFCEDTGNNAVYIHTENPNGTPFPYEFSNVVWNVPPSPELIDIVDSTTHEIGQESFSEEVVTIVRKKEAN